MPIHRPALPSARREFWREKGARELVDFDWLRVGFEADAPMLPVRRGVSPGLLDACGAQLVGMRGA